MSIISIDGDKLELIVDALKSASDHLDYCGYGDSWEREVLKGDDPLDKKIEAALSLGAELLKEETP